MIFCFGKRSIAEVERSNRYEVQRNVTHSKIRLRVLVNDKTLYSSLPDQRNDNATVVHRLEETRHSQERLSEKKLIIASIPNKIMEARTAL